jgi:hypothetical protein
MLGGGGSDPPPPRHPAPRPARNHRRRADLLRAGDEGGGEVRTIVSEWVIGADGDGMVKVSLRGETGMEVVAFQATGDRMKEYAVRLYAAACMAIAEDQRK